MLTPRTTPALICLPGAWRPNSGPLGIRIATVAPRHIRASGDIQCEKATGTGPRSLRQEIPLGRFGEPEEVAEAVYFLASSDASYINGSILHVDRGWSSS
ncbi:SDR family oxidoreductase [Rhizobium sp. Nf11,1]|uniref:SDR family oxidoreductase n=1 Tax=unclassified Rhizobium TaxID=2613769 RepID=UPI003D351986